MTDAASPEEKKIAAPRKRRLRLILMPLVPVLIIGASGWVWATQSRYVSTDNAYVKRDVVQVSPDVAGRIIAVNVQDGSHVKAGDLLFRVDPEPYKAKLATAETAVDVARLHVETLKAAYRQALAGVPPAEETAGYDLSELARQKTLLASGGTPQATVDQAQHTYNAATEALALARQAVDSAKAALGGNPDIETDKHPEVISALAARDQAALDLARCDQKASVSGTVGNAGLLSDGYYATPGIAVFAIVQDGKGWVEANLKETELTHVQAGQSAEVELDAYPGRKIRALVETLGAGTGAEFALLPPQNATGNWVKVVQRVPVRLSLEDVPAGLNMQTGLSATVTVDTGYMPPLAADILGIASAAGIQSAAAGSQK